MSGKGQSSPLRIGITGSYGGFNLGDEAILQVVLAEIGRRAKAEITIFSRDADDTAERHPGARVVPIPDSSRAEITPEIVGLDLLILGGGGVLFDGGAPLFLRALEIAQEHDVPTAVWAIGAGPLEKPETQRLVKRVLERAGAVTVRERNALRVLEDCGIRREIQVTADPAVLLEKEPLPADAIEREGLGGPRPLVGLSVREPGIAAPDIDEDHYHALLANAADYMVERLDADLVFVPMERDVLDVQHSHAVIAQMAHPSHATVLKGEYSPGQMVSLVERFAFAVGMRLHFLIFAVLAGVPFVALPYAGKVMGLLDALGIDAPPMQTVNAGRLIAHIDRSWDLRETLVREIAAALPALQAQARRNVDVAMAVLGERS